MIEFVELRGFADSPFFDGFPATEGDVVGSGIRKVIVRGDDPRLPGLASLHAAARAAGDRRGLRAFISRKYSREEWRHAELFRLEIQSRFEPAGEESGTEYDFTAACPICGAGRVRRGPLRLRVRGIPRGSLLAQTIAGDEIVASERLVAAIRDAGLTGVEFEAIEAEDAKRGAAPQWFSLRISSTPLRLAPAVRLGSSILHTDEVGCCPIGDTIGYAVLSETLLTRPAVPSSDFHETLQYVGSRAGVTVPRRLLLISKRAERLLAQVRAPLLYMEVARFVD